METRRRHPGLADPSKPNDWGKQVRAAAHAATLTERGQLYWDFWFRFSERVKAQHPTWTRGISTKNSWVSMSAGSSGAQWAFVFSTEGLSAQLEFLDRDPQVNTARFEALLLHREQLEIVYGGPLIWEPKEGFKATRVAARTLVANVADTERWDESTGSFRLQKKCGTQSNRWEAFRLNPMTWPESEQSCAIPSRDVSERLERERTLRSWTSDCLEKSP